MELRSHLCENGYPSNWEEVSRAVRERDDYHCKSCGTEYQVLHVHHVIPLSRGGSNNISNLITLCEKCHINKHPHMRR
ncbi:MAG: HNH endonuclease [Candidatus Aminicenantes bacterium]|nr:HNH endonuclease [Candidatus Aminicenantes bacterium]